MNKNHSANVFVGSLYNKMMVFPLFPQDKPFTYGGGRKAPITSIYSSSKMNVEHKINSLYSNQRELFVISDSKNTENQQNNEENNAQQQITHNYCTKLTQLPQSCHESIKIIGCSSDCQNYFMSTNTGQIYYSKIQSDNPFCIQQQPIKIYDNLSQFNNKCPNIKQIYRKCITYDQSNHFVMLGKGVLPFLVDKQVGMISWKGKNVKNDHLDLQVPIDDVDGCFFESGQCLALANASNKIRIYDIRSRTRKPTADYTLKQITQKTNLSTMTINKDESYIYLGNKEGGIYQVDIRKDCQISGKYKGITTTIKNIEVTQHFLISCSSDSYIRIFDKESRKLQEKIYMNASPSCMSISFDFEENYRAYLVEKQIQQAKDKQTQIKNNDRSLRKNKIRQRQHNQSQDNDEVKDQGPRKIKKKVKQLRNRNKVGLWYLKPENIGEFPDPQSQQDQAIKYQVKKEEIDHEESSSLI